MPMNALDFATEKLKTIPPFEIAKNSGCQWNKQEETLVVPYLGRQYHIKASDFSFKEADINTREKILIFHYLARSKNISETENLISFSELEAGNIYKPSIEARVYRVLTDKFGSHVEDFLRKARLLGGQETHLGKFSVKIQVFPKICVYFIFYPADDEFPASCQILFDSSIKQLLETEDVVVMCEEITERLVS